MKKKFSRILAVGLTVALMASLILAAAPVSAGTLSWSDKTIPSEDDYVLWSCNITDLAVAEDGAAIYAAVSGVSDNVIYRSTDLGVSWSAISGLSINATLVAVAPDDANYVAIALNGTEAIYVSDDAGATWDSLGAIDAIDVINDLALSAEKSGNHFCAVVGDNSSGGATVWNYEIGAVGGDWEEISKAIDTDFVGFADNQTSAAAVAFSPNFASDETLVTVTGNSTEVIFQAFAFNQELWNEASGTFEDYPVTIVDNTTDADVSELNSASISLSPDYLGSDDAMRLAFVSLACTEDDEASGIFRLDDDDVEVLKDEKQIHSVAYDGVNLVAGRYDGNDVYRCADPLASSPSVSGSASLKSPGGVDLVVVAWAGDDVVAGTSGDESAFAVSRDDGKAFNDISLIDTTFDTLTDVAVSPDGSNVYLLSDNTSSMSLWRYASSWERVLTVPDKTNFIVRTAPDDPDVVYVAEIGGTAIYYSADAGETRWQTRTCRYPITDDLAVETDGGVVYVLSTNGYVSQSTNSGYSWATWKSSKLTNGGNMLTSLGEDVLLAGSQDGYVSYSTDGGTTWTKLDERIVTGTNAVQVIGTGVTADDFIYASTNKTGDDIYRWDWADEEWDAIYEDVGDDDSIKGIALQDGVLYLVSANATSSTSYRTLDPTSDTPTWSTMVEVGAWFNATPSALRASGGSNDLWAVSTNMSELYSYADTLSDVGPSLVAPKHGFTNIMNVVTGRAFDVTFVWERPSTKVEGYDLRIALDEGFDEVLRTVTVVEDDPVVSQIAGPHGDADIDADVEFMPGTTYYWKVRVSDPVYSPWSVIYTLSVEEAVAPFPEVTVEAPPVPEITVEAPPAPEITVEVPPITIPAAPAIPAYLLWAIIVIGAVLIIALIVLIVRTRRVV
ncbi:hypothetical protein ES706_03965 [subsurface metagenome]